MQRDFDARSIDNELFELNQIEDLAVDRPGVEVVLHNTDSTLDKLLHTVLFLR